MLPFVLLAKLDLFQVAQKLTHRVCHCPLRHQGAIYCGNLFDPGAVRKGVMALQVLWI